MYCDKCGAKIQDHAKFCTECGNPIASRASERKPVDKQPSKKPINPWLFGIILSLIFLVFFRVANSVKTEKASQLIAINPIDIDYLDCHIKYIRHEIIEGAKPRLLVYYQFENNDNEEHTHKFDSLVNEFAYQDLVLLDWAYDSSQAGKDSDVLIKPGASITVCSSFYLRNLSSDVELTMRTDMILFNEDLATMTLKLK